MRHSLWLSVIAAVVLVCSQSGCAAGPTPATPAAQSPTTVPSPTAVLFPTPGTQTGKLSPRLQLLADTPSLRAASAEDQARALSLPPTGPGSLVRDAQGRILVTMRTSDVSDASQKALRDAGANIQNVSERYQSITAFVPLTQLNAVAALPAVQNVQEELAPVPGGGRLSPFSTTQLT